MIYGVLKIDVEIYSTCVSLDKDVQYISKHVLLTEYIEMSLCFSLGLCYFIV